MYVYGSDKVSFVIARRYTKNFLTGAEFVKDAAHSIRSVCDCNNRQSQENN